MGYCSYCGNWVDEGSICTHCGGSGDSWGSSGYDEGEDHEDEFDYISRPEYFIRQGKVCSRDREVFLTKSIKPEYFIRQGKVYSIKGDHKTAIKLNEYEKKAWDLYMEFKEEEALHYINMALDLDDENAYNWNIKAIILEAMKRYDESEECYNRSLELSPKNKVYDNKAGMLYDWAVQLRDESKKVPNGLDMLNDAYDKVMKAMNALPGENTQEDLEKYLKLRDSINFCIDSERKYLGDLEALNKYDKNELFTITGMHFYKNDVALTQGMPLRLVKEPDNEFDRDAIAVYAEDEKIGYIANNVYTKFELTSLASKLQDKIEDISQGSYLLHLGKYPAIQFHIGRIVK